MKTISKQTIVLSIILLLIGVSVSSAISVDTKSTISNNQSEECKECNEVSDADLVKVERLLDKVEVYSKLLLVLSKHNPEFREISEELLNEITIVNNKVNGNFGYCLLLLIQFAISVYLFTFFDLMHNELPEGSTLYEVFLNLCHYYINKSEELYDSGKDYDCWWWEVNPHP